jgi:enoyl-CoA hydratase
MISNPMNLENILLEIDAPLALITINRPDKHNAISLATLDELHHAVDAAAADESVRVIAITGVVARLLPGRI